MKREVVARAIEEYEHQADQVTHATMALLHKTFITPLEREDIHQLISKLDDIVDMIDAAAQRVVMYDIREKTPEFVSLTEICGKSCELIQKVVSDLNNIKNPAEILKHCIEINRLENEADHLLRVGLARLFKDENDIKRLIKYKELYEVLEEVTDRCEDVANIVEGIVLEYA
jgi:predicted phosphate transport protein (TIGR00153 family)